MSAWSWSLLQFGIVLTAKKKFPELDNDGETISAIPKIQEKTHSASSSFDDPDNKLPNQPKTQANCSNVIPSDDHCEEEEIVEIVTDAQVNENNKEKKGILIRAGKKITVSQKKEIFFHCFCFYNEIWGIVMTILFQDGPFFIIRMIILFYYKIVTQMNIFFVGKNILVICLLINRIRVIFKEEKKKWTVHMEAAQKQEVINH